MPKVLVGLLYEFSIINHICIYLILIKYLHYHIYLVIRSSFHNLPHYMMTPKQNQILQK